MTESDLIDPADVCDGPMFAAKDLPKVLLSYFKLNSGRLQNPTGMRHKAIFLQLVMFLVASTFAWLWHYNVEDTVGFFRFLCYLWNLLWLVAAPYFGYALFLSLKDNVPKMVTTKNAVGLFMFTLLFFESAILSGLFFILGFVLHLTDTELCSSAFCSGMIWALFFNICALTGISTAVIYHSKVNLGIGVFETFGL